MEVFARNIVPHSPPLLPTPSEVYSRIFGCQLTFKLLSDFNPDAEGRIQCHMELIGCDQFVFNYNKLCPNPVTSTDVFPAHPTRRVLLT